MDDLSQAGLIGSVGPSYARHFKCMFTFSTQRLKTNILSSSQVRTHSAQPYKSISGWIFVWRYVLESLEPLSQNVFLIHSECFLDAYKLGFLIPNMTPEASSEYNLIPGMERTESEILLDTAAKWRFCSLCIMLQTDLFHCFLSMYHFLMETTTDSGTHFPHDHSQSHLFTPF